MQFMPNSRIFLSFGSLQITWYAVLILTGAILAYLLSQHMIKKWGYASSLLENYLFPLLICGIIGARLYYVAFEWDYYSLHPEYILATWQGGLAIHGGLIAGILFSVYYFRKNKVSLWRMFDLIMPHVLLAQAFGRWGNFANQEAYGRIVKESFYQYFPAFIKNQMYIDGAYRMPTFLFESVLDFLGFLLIVLVFRRFFYRKRGDAGFAYFIWYGCSRFFVEGLRTDSLMLGQLRIAQVISIVFIGIGLLGILGAFQRLIAEKPVLLFDVDGTLSNSRKTIECVWDALFKEEKPDYLLSPEEKESFFGPTVNEVLSWYFHEDQIARLHQRYDELYLENIQYLEIYPQVKTTLEQLKSEGYKMGIVSNKTNNLIQADLKQGEINAYFDVVYGVDQCTKPKPSPIGLIEACSALGQGHDNLVYVGDSSGDVWACQQIAAYSIVYSKDVKDKSTILKMRPCRVIHEYSSLIKLLHEEKLWCDRKVW